MRAVLEGAGNRVNGDVRARCGFSFDPRSNTLFIVTPADDTNGANLLAYAKSKAIFRSYSAESGTAAFSGSDEYAKLIERFKDRLPSPNLSASDASNAPSKSEFIGSWNSRSEGLREYRRILREAGVNRVGSPNN